DGGANWKNVTPADMKEGIVNSIEVSPHDPATAYITLMRYKSMDLRPYIYKTTDYGQSWIKLVNGFTDEHTFVRVVREDPVRKGLLYAGAETGLYISLDDGQNWQPFQLNLPVVPINDLVVQDNDLVAATAGRSFWILDDLGALQQLSKSDKNLSLFKPKDTYLIFGGSSERPIPGLGDNPKSGVTFDYYLGKDADSIELKLEVLENNKVIRTITSIKPKEFKSWPGGPSKPQVLPAKKGYNRFTWNFRRASLPAVDKVFLFGSHDGSRVAPGEYTLRLSLENEQVETNVKILANPNIEASSEDYQDQQLFLKEIEGMITEIHESVNQMRSAKRQLTAYAELLENNEKADTLVARGETLLKRIDSWETNLIQPKQKTFQDVINYNNQLNAELTYLKDFVDTADPIITNGAKERLNDLKKDWSVYQKERDDIITSEMSAYNDLFSSLKIPALIMD
ncbi:MAG: glycosyl hydrolase, partial [Lutimonas sp.]